MNWPLAPSQTTPPAATTVSFGHSYDATNRRVGQTASDNSWLYYPGAASTVSYTANELNQYTAVGSVSPTYDGNGNLTFDGTFTYGYDAENRLTSASGGGISATYAYDAQGRRKTKTVNGTTTIFVTDASNREVLEYDGNSGAISNWYAYALGPNDVLNQMNVAASTRVTLIRTFRDRSWVSRFGNGRADEVRVLALRREQLDERKLPLYRATDRCRDQRSLFPVPACTCPHGAGSCSPIRSGFRVGRISTRMSATTR